jgi:hypothetical protein
MSSVISKSKNSPKHTKDGVDYLTQSKDKTKVYKFNDPDPHSFIDMGVKKINQKAKSIKVNGKMVAIEDTLVVNPFFTGIDGGSVLSMPPKDIHQNYKHLYVLCLSDTIVHNEECAKLIMNIFLRTVDKQLFERTCANFVMVKAPMSLLRNYVFKKRANLIEGTVLDEYFKKSDGLKYEFDEIVIPLFELNETKTHQYIKMYGGDMSLGHLGTLLSLAGFYNKYSNHTVDSHIIGVISSIDSSAYWKNPKNCNFNMNDVFNQRSLSYNGHRLDQIKYATINGAKTINDVLPLNAKKKPVRIAKDDNYLEGINDEPEKKNNMRSEHMNIYQVLRNCDKRTFYATTDEGQFCFTKEDIADRFDKVSNEQYRFKLLNTLLVSKDLCHFVINNKRVLQRNADLFEKYKPLYAYLFGYAWTTFYLEESIFTTRSTKKHRFAYDIDTARELPLFPFSMENIHNNPYVSLLLNRDLIDPATNCMSVNALEDYKKYYGLCTREEALSRFNSFVSGKNGVNIFRNLDSKIFSFSGSVMPACLQRRSPLMDLCTSDDMNFDDIYGTYFAHYYGEADIDVMCNAPTMAEFLSHASAFMETVVKNIGCKREDFKVIPNKKTAVIISKHFFRECIDDLNAENDTSYTTDQLIKVFENSLSLENENINTIPPEILNYFYADYVQEKNISIKKWRTLQKMNNVEFDVELVSSFNTVTSIDNMTVKMVSYDIPESDLKRKDSEVCYFINNFRDPEHQVPKEKNFLVFKFAESIKYKIESSKLKRTIELFKIDSVDPFNTVARFHKPCVRAYLQGDTFHMLPSFITAMMSMINIDYKYFAGSRDPIDIINKYRSRGYGVILNASEKKGIGMYNKNVDTCNGMFGIASESECFGPKSLNDKIYKPGVYKLGLPLDIYKNSNHRYINNVAELEAFYKKNHMMNPKMPIQILEFTTIDKTGNVSPIQMWVADAYYELMNR